MPSVKINNCKISYQDHGQKNSGAIIFLHGLGSRKEDWRFQTKFFSKNFRCISVDLRGFGKSDRCPPYSINGFANDIMELAEILKISSLHLVGISLGGMVALQIAVNRPQILKSLTIVNVLSEFKLKGFRENLTFYSRFFLVKFLGIRFLGKVLAKKLFPHKKQKNLRQKFTRNFANNDERAYLTTLRSVKGWSVVEHLEKISCKTLFIAAKYDYISLAAKKFFAKKMHAKIVEMKDSHHAAPAENPQEFNRILWDFLAAISSNTN